MNKIAVVSDIHGNIVALEKVVEDIQKRQVDAVFNLGDHLSGPLWPKETAQFLMRQNWVQIAGNHDREMAHQDPNRLYISDQQALQLLGQPELDWLKELPPLLRLPEGFVLFHGAPSDDLSYFLETVEHGRARVAAPAEIQKRLDGIEAKVILCGHSHTPRAMKIPGGAWSINPGSVGLPAYEYDFPEPHVVETGSPHARYAVIELQDGGWKVENVAVPYDYEKAAAQAAKNHRPDWEIALRTGYIKIEAGG